MRNLVSASLLAALSMTVGCAQKDGVYVIFLPSFDDFECETTIEENFIEAEPPVEEEVISDWEYTYEATESDAIMFARILEGSKNEVYLVINSNNMGSAVYPGSIDGGVMTFEWVNSTDNEEVSDYQNSDYTYTVTEVATVTTTVTMSKDKEQKGGYAGTWSTKTVSEETHIETDEWDNTDYQLPGSGQINGFARNRLVYEGQGQLSNDADVEDCAGSNCEVTDKTTCNGSANFKARPTDWEDDFESLRNVGQDYGT